MNQDMAMLYFVFSNICVLLSQTILAKVCCRRLFPHFLIIFIFLIHLGLGTLGFYYILQPYYVKTRITKEINQNVNATESVEQQKRQTVIAVDSDYDESRDANDCRCKDQNVLIIDKRSASAVDEHSSLIAREDKRKPSHKWTLKSAVVLSFYHMTSIGSSEFHVHSLGVKTFASIFTFLGILVSFLTLADLSLLFFDAVYLALNRLRRNCRSCCKSKKPFQYSPNKPKVSVKFTKRVNPLVFFLILLAYCCSCSAGFAFISGRHFVDTFFDCFFLAFGFWTKPLLILPASWFFVQLLYIFMGFIIVGALFRSMGPILEKIYGSRAQTVRIIEHVTVPFDNERLTGSPSSDGALLYSIASESIPFADDRTSTAATSIICNI